LQWELSKFRDLLTNKVIISFDINNLFFNLVKEGAALKILLFIICEKDGEVAIRFRQNINVDVPFRIRLPSFLHNIGA
jgi:hypothetical protein